MQQSFLCYANQYTSNGMHDALWDPSRPGRINDEKRIPEVDALEHQLLLSMTELQETVKSNRSGHILQMRGLSRESGLDYNPLELAHTLHPLHNLFNLRPQIDSLPIIHRKVIRKQIRRFDLQQPLQNPFRPHIR